MGDLMNYACVFLISIMEITQIQIISSTARKTRNQANKRARIPRIQYCFSINAPAKEERLSLALE